MTALLPTNYSFECPHCLSILSLPVELEGVTGPCPQCHSTITAPPRQPPAPTLSIPAMAPTFPPVPVPPPEIQNAPFYPPVPPSAPPPQFLTPAPDPTPAPIPTWMDLVGESPAPVEAPAAENQFTLPQAPTYSVGPPSRSWVLKLGLLAGIAGAAVGVYFLFSPPSGGRPPAAPVANPVVPETAPPPPVEPAIATIPQTPSGELPPDEDLPSVTSPVIPRLESPTVPSPSDPAPPDSAPPAAEPPSTQIETPEIRRAHIQPTPGLLIEEIPATAAKVDSLNPMEPSDTPPAPSILQQPRNALESFLAAPNWQQRLPMIQHADKLRPQILDYYTSHSDGVVKTDSVDFLTSQPTPNGNEVFYLFNVQMKGGHAFPVAVEKMQGSYRIDWQSFVEFKDLLLPEFFKTYSPESASFHVVLERKHYFGTDVPNQDRKLCFSVEPPVPGYSNYAWVSDSDLELITKLGVRAEFGQTSYPIVTLRWVKETNGVAYVVLEKIRSDNWRSDIIDSQSADAAPPVQEKPQDKSAETPAESAPKRAKIVR